MKASQLHPDVWSRLLALRLRPAHAILLAGPYGLAKTSLALEFAAYLLCESPVTHGACGSCHACTWFAQGNHPDFRLLRPDADATEAGSDTSVASSKSKPSREIRMEQVRALGDFLVVGTHRGGERVIVVTPAEAMNRNTANSLLKSLEEPAPGTRFILVTNSPDELLPTLRSRCLSIAVPLPAKDTSILWMSAAGITDAERWLGRAGGAPCLAKSIAEGAEGRLMASMEDLLSSSRSFDSRKAASEIEKLLRANDDLEMISVVSWIQRWITDGLLLQYGLPAKYSVGRKVSEGVSVENLCKINASITQFKILSKHTLNMRLFLESLFDLIAPIMPTGPR